MANKTNKIFGHSLLFQTNTPAIKQVHPLSPGMSFSGSASSGADEEILLCGSQDVRDFRFRTFRIRYPVHSGELPSSSNDHDSTGFTLWTQALEAAIGALDDRPDLIWTRRVVEVGCGLGILGMICRELGARTVTLTDQNDAALQMAQKTISLNSRIPDVRTAVWDWGKTKPPEKTEYVVGSDVIFSSAAARQLAADLINLKVGFLIGHQKRRAVYRDPLTGEIRTEEEDSALKTFLNELAPHCKVDVFDLENDCCVLKGRFEIERKRGRSDSMEDVLEVIRSPRRRAVHPGCNAFSDAVAVAFMATTLNDRNEPKEPPSPIPSSCPSTPPPEGEEPARMRD